MLTTHSYKPFLAPEFSLTAYDVHSFATTKILPELTVSPSLLSPLQTAESLKFQNEITKPQHHFKANPFLYALRKATPKKVKELISQTLEYQGPSNKEMIANSVGLGFFTGLIFPVPYAHIFAGAALAKMTGQNPYISALCASSCMPPVIAAHFYLASHIGGLVFCSNPVAALAAGSVVLSVGAGLLTRQITLWGYDTFRNQTINLMEKIIEP